MSGARVSTLTATATPEVRADIEEQLGLGESRRGPPQLLVHGFRRPNLVLRVARTAGDDPAPVTEDDDTDDRPLVPSY